jgi:hypothetical protein
MTLILQKIIFHLKDAVEFRMVEDEDGDNEAGGQSNRYFFLLLTTNLDVLKYCNFLLFHRVLLRIQILPWSVSKHRYPSKFFLSVCGIDSATIVLAGTQTCLSASVQSLSSCTSSLWILPGLTIYGRSSRMITAIHGLLAVDSRRALTARR